MKAICVTPDRNLEVRDVPAPASPPPGHVIVKMDASAINHGDKTFLARPDAAGAALAGSKYGIWGASGAGMVIAAGAGVPQDCDGRKVAIYRSLSQTPETIGLWSEFAQVLYTACLVLPDEVSPRDYCGSLVNVFTAQAFLKQIMAENHTGIIITAGNSATGSALAVLAQRQNVATISLVQSSAAGDELGGYGIRNVINLSDVGSETSLADIAVHLGASVVFDGVGGALVSRLAPILPMNTVVYFYGMLSGGGPVNISTSLFMAKHLTFRRFSNFESQTARDAQQRAAAMDELSAVIAGPVFKTKVGMKFTFNQIDEAMAYEARPGVKAVLAP